MFGYPWCGSQGKCKRHKILLNRLCLRVSLCCDRRDVPHLRGHHRGFRCHRHEFRFRGHGRGHLHLPLIPCLP